jgi:hypothetical protein
MAGIFDAKLAPSLLAHLQGVDIQALSRTDISRLATSAIPNIGRIELVDSNGFEDAYKSLYLQSFPIPEERERTEWICSRLDAHFAGERAGLAPYRIVGIRDAKGEAIGASQFAILLLNGGKYAVPYLQYLYVRNENRRQHMSEVLHTMTFAVTAAVAREMGNRIVPFTLFETEPPGHGDEEESRAFSIVRSQIHTRGGAVAIILKRDGQDISPHVQPGLEVGASPVSLVWAVRPSNVPRDSWTIEGIGKDLIAAYYQCLRDEGIAEDNIRLAESIVEERCSGSTWALIPLGQTRFHQI